MDYCFSPYIYRRRPTRVVNIGDVSLGGAEPIRVQSMTTPPTTDTQATVDQVERLVDVGCEIVRITVPAVSDANNLPQIRAEMRRRRVRVPLVADIHYSPAAAMAVIEHVEKIRVNPGNYADSRQSVPREYTDAEYGQELERIAERFSPLVVRARELGVAIRVGTNHGSLSDRILNRYGDTPDGMVESALEFVRICRSHDVHALVLSMKSSNPMVMIQAYRLLAARMAEEGMDYPFHLGVTEAGEGPDGRVKSAVGIGALLEDGIGDTVRVSLTEDPVEEIPVAIRLVEPYNSERQAAVPSEAPFTVHESRDPFRYARRSSAPIQLGETAWGGDQPPRVEVGLAGAKDGLERLRDLAGPAVAADVRPDLAEVSVAPAGVARFLELRGELDKAGIGIPLAARIEPALWPASDVAEHAARLARGAARLTVVVPPEAGPGVDAWAPVVAAAGRPVLWEIRVDSADAMQAASEIAVRQVRAAQACGAEALLALGAARGVPVVGAYRLLAARLAQEDLRVPLVLVDGPAGPEEDVWIGASSRLGSLLCDGIGDAVRVDGPEASESVRLAFTLLQGTRLRLSRTEFISCPSCGRTLFDLESTTRRIKEKTGHLKGVDADFGYVGGAPGKVNLFVGREMIAKHVPAAQADDRLIELIKSRGKWVDPPQPETATPACGTPGGTAEAGN